MPTPAMVHVAADELPQDAAVRYSDVPDSLLTVPIVLGLVSATASEPEVASRRLWRWRAFILAVMVLSSVCGISAVVIWPEQTARVSQLGVALLISVSHLPLAAIFVTMWRRPKREAIEQLFAVTWKAATPASRKWLLSFSRNLKRVFGVLLALYLFAAPFILFNLVGSFTAVLIIIWASFAGSFVSTGAILFALTSSALLSSHVEHLSRSAYDMDEIALLRSFNVLHRAIDSHNSIIGPMFSYSFITFSLQWMVDAISTLFISLLAGIMQLLFVLPILLLAVRQLTIVSYYASLLRRRIDRRFGRYSVICARKASRMHAAADDTDLEAASCHSAVEELALYDDGEDEECKPLSQRAYLYIGRQRIAIQIAGLDMTPSLLGRVGYIIVSIAFVLGREAL
eukprot:PLAT9424.3.p1 GENE.PLAT9424.3~~PLAT9424.3.p1  ORF type:complete len:399 (-),score=127.90 PLAT9424.3:72-1268(-)